MINKRKTRTTNTLSTTSNAKYPCWYFLILKIFYELLTSQIHFKNSEIILSTAYSSLTAFGLLAAYPLSFLFVFVFLLYYNVYRVMVDPLRLGYLPYVNIDRYGQYRELDPGCQIRTTNHYTTNPYHDYV